MPKGVHQRDTSMSPAKPRSRMSRTRGRQVQSGQGSTGRDRAVKRRSRR